jgi:hypothetical protein
MMHAGGNKRFKILEAHTRKYQGRHDSLIEILHPGQELVTGNNGPAMNRTVAQIARHFVHSEDVPEPVPNRIEHGIRSCDPCLSCSTHAASQMPMKVRLIGPGSRVLKEVVRG